jgi:uncharacterized membrane protein
MTPDLLLYLFLAVVVSVLVSILAAGGLLSSHRQVEDDRWRRLEERVARVEEEVRRVREEVREGRV